MAATPSCTDLCASASAAEETDASASPAALTALLADAAHMLAQCAACDPPLLREEAATIFSEFVAKLDARSAIGFAHLIVRELRARFPNPNVEHVLRAHAVAIAGLDSCYTACGISSALEEDLSTYSPTTLTTTATHALPSLGDTISARQLVVPDPNWATITFAPAMNDVPMERLFF